MWRRETCTVSMTVPENRVVEHDDDTSAHISDMVRDTLSIGKEVYRESLPILLAALGGGIIAGSILGEEQMMDAFETIPGLLLMLPALMDERGNIFGAMGARIATGLHQGLIEPRFTWQDRLQTVFLAALINTLFLAVFVAGSSVIILNLLGMSAAPFTTLVSITLIAGLLNAVTMPVILVTLLFLGHQRGWDPNILNGPIVTTAGDIFGIGYLYIAVILVGVVL